MKTAKVTVRALEFWCPDCHEPIETDWGGHMHENVPPQLECSWCKQTLKVPALARKLMDRK